MAKLQKFLIVAIAASIFWLSTYQMSKTFASDEEPKMDTDSVNEVGLHAIFQFREGVEVVNTFKVFDTMSSGFDRTKPLTFKLEGVIGWDRPILYKAIDTTFNLGKNSQHDYSEFDVDIIFQRGEKPYRQFAYTDCQIKNYNVYTEYDKEETYNAKTDFVYLDRIEFECRGFTLGNPTYEQTQKDQIIKKTEAALEQIMQKKNENH